MASTGSSQLPVFLADSIQLPMVGFFLGCYHVVYDILAIMPSSIAKRLINDILQVLPEGSKSQWRGREEGQVPGSTLTAWPRTTVVLALDCCSWLGDTGLPCSQSGLLLPMGDGSKFPLRTIVYTNSYYFANFYKGAIVIGIVGPDMFLAKRWY